MGLVQGGGIWVCAMRVLTLARPHTHNKGSPLDLMGLCPLGNMETQPGKGASANSRAGLLPGPLLSDLPLLLRHLATLHWGKILQTDTPLLEVEELIGVPAGVPGWCPGSATWALSPDHLHSAAAKRGHPLPSPGSWESLPLFPRPTPGEHVTFTVT